MICITLQAFDRACSSVSGGISDLIAFDPDDFNFTQAAPISGVAQPYTAVALRDDAVGSGATAPTCTLTLTDVGTDGDVISVYYKTTLLGTFTKTSSETDVTALATALKNAINAGSSGFTATNVAGVITVTAPSSYGAAINTVNLLVDATGGIDFTRTAFSGGVTGDGGKMYAINFTRDEAEWQWKQSVKGCNVKYDHTFNFQLPENSQSLTTFLQALDNASCCCGLGMIIRLTGGRIFVCGEKWVNGSSLPKFIVLQNGSSGGSGKLYDDFNGGNIVITGPYSRNLYEYTGSWDDIVALED